MRNSNQLPTYGYTKVFDDSPLTKPIFPPEIAKSITLLIGTGDLENFNYRGMEIKLDTDFAGFAGGNLYVGLVTNETITDEFKFGDHSFFEFVNCIITKTSGFNNCCFINCTFNVPITADLFKSSCTLFEAHNCEFLQGINNFYSGIKTVYIFDSLIKKEFIMNEEPQGNNVRVLFTKTEKNCLIDVNENILWY